MTSINYRSHTYTDVEINAAQKIQRFWKINRARFAMNDYLNCKIHEISNQNFQELSEQLSSGPEFLKNLQVKGANTEPTLIEYCLETVRSVFDNIYPLPKPVKLSTREVTLFTMAIENFTLKHSSPEMESIRNNDNELISVRERMRRGKNIANRRTYGHHRDDFVYFTMGIGDHPTKYTVTSQHSEVIVNLEKLMNENPKALTGAWVSNHDSAYYHNHINRTVDFDGTKFHFSCDSKTLTKTYFYERANGTQYQWKVSRNGEIFSGPHILPAIAMKLILHLRLIGGSYRDHLLNSLNDCTIPKTDKIKYLQAAMEHIMPGWTYPEVKVPISFPLSHPAIKIDEKDVIGQKIQDAHANSSSLLFEVQLRSPQELQSQLDKKIQDTRDKSITIFPDINELVHWRDSLIDILFRSFPDIYDGGNRFRSVLFTLIDSGISLKRQWINIITQYSPTFFFGHSISIYRKLIENGLDVNPSSVHSLTPLMQASRHQHDSTVQFLIDKVDINKRYIASAPCSSDGYTALHFAVVSNSGTIPRMLLLNGANPNIKAKNGATPLMLARLIEEGRPVKPKTRPSPLRKEAESTKELLTSHGATCIDPIPDNFRPIHYDSVVVIVTGVNRLGEKILLMGNKVDDKGYLNPTLHFPGGFKEILDENYENAAIREIDEETNLQIKEKVTQGHAKIKIIALDGFDSADNIHRYTTGFVEIDIGNYLGATRTIGKDDLPSVSKRKFKDFNEETNCFGNSRVRTSNAIILKALIHPENKNWNEELEFALKIELQPTVMLQDAIKSGDLKLFHKILEHPALLDTKVDYSKLVKTIGKTSKFEFVEKLLFHLRTCELDTEEKEYIIGYSINYSIMPLINYCLDNGEYSLEDLLITLKSLLKVGRIELFLKFLEIIFSPRYNEKMKNRLLEELKCSATSEKDQPEINLAEARMSCLKSIEKWAVKYNQPKALEALKSYS